ncbi:hypothetical protein PFLUV_G00160810 [Perca fluviatilis]|uniref:Fibronectin type-III domain-containing protein n=1 Tax=Perca fluviatilis TaxID=8168 RepID=A0A6A5ESF3_PERFL|nr:hypothetical protein PFLUV_G00160810 [Perca fluviatilis]
MASCQLDRWTNNRTTPGPGSGELLNTVDQSRFDGKGDYSELPIQLVRSQETYDLRRCLVPPLSAASRMQFSVRLSVCVLGFVLVSLFPQPARGQVSTPRRFRAKVLSPTKLHVSWKEPKGQFESYKVIYTTRPGGEQKEIQVSKQEAKLVIQDFDPSKEYNFKIIAVSGGQQSKPLQAKHEAQSGVEMVESQRGRDGGVAEENNEISEGKNRGKGKPGEEKHRNGGND